MYCSWIEIELICNTRASCIKLMDPEKMPYFKFSMLQASLSHPVQIRDSKLINVLSIVTAPWVVKWLNVESWRNRCPCSAQNCTALLACRQVQTHCIGWVRGVPIVGCHHPRVETIGTICHVGRRRWRVACRCIHIGSWSKQRSNYRKHFRHWFVAMEFVKYKSTIYLCGVHPGRNVYLHQIRCGVFCVQLGLGVGSGGQILGKTQESCVDHLQKKE